MKKMITLTQDNGSCNKKYGLEEGCYSVSLEYGRFESLTKMFFNWRTTTKKFSSYLERFNSIGSSNRDKFIAWVYLTHHIIQKANNK